MQFKIKIHKRSENENSTNYQEHNIFCQSIVIMTSCPHHASKNGKPYYKYHGDMIEEVIPEKEYFTTPVNRAGTPYSGIWIYHKPFAYITQFVYSCGRTVWLTRAPSNFSQAGQTCGERPDVRQVKSVSSCRNSVSNMKRFDQTPQS